jgi:hypothetical protein
MPLITTQNHAGGLFEVLVIEVVVVSMRLSYTARREQRQLWYHGGPRITDWNNLRWDRERGTSDGNAEGPGMYWTTDFDEAAGYTHHPDSTIYVATMRDGFRLVPKKRPTMAALRELFSLAEPDDQEIFLSNWQIEMPVTKQQIDSVLVRYSRQTTAFDAFVTLYHDLFRYDAGAFVNAMRSMGFDGYVLEKGTTGGSRLRKHLVLYNVRALEIEATD